jgi:aryl-alcohol dehydrogenase-like predicted oxidoreductase
MVLGTAQLGMVYGRANSDGMPSDEDARDLLVAAERAGIAQVDTARLYGQAERRLGAALSSGAVHSLEPLTKLGIPDRIPPEATEGEIARLVLDSVTLSCRELGVSRLPVLMLHRWAHRSSSGGIVWRTLLRLREEGVIDRLGASAQSPQEALEALRDPDVEHLQLPMNLLDTRWDDRGVPAAALARPSVVVHARSVYLQGLLVSPPEVWPAIDGVDPDGIVRALDGLRLELGRISVADLCVAYVRGLPWIQGIVVGLEKEVQLSDNVVQFARPFLSDEERVRVRERLPRVPEALLDPSQWP